MIGSKKGNKGFTLIELLIVVAILGVLAAVVIPNVGRFIGKGEQEAQKTEAHNVQTAVIAMMTDNNLTSIPIPIGVNTNDMTAFPDATTTHGASGVGYLLFAHDFDGDGTGDTNYVTFPNTTWTYTVTSDGMVTQGPKP